MRAILKSLMSCTKCAYFMKISTASFYGKSVVFGKPLIIDLLVDR